MIPDGWEYPHEPFNGNLIILRRTKTLNENFMPEYYFFPEDLCQLITFKGKLT